MTMFFNSKRLLRLAAALIALVLMAFVIPQARASAIPGQGTWETTLKPRDLDGNLATIEAWYDTDLNITWLADTNIIKTKGIDKQLDDQYNTCIATAASKSIPESYCIASTYGGGTGEVSGYVAGYALSMIFNNNEWRVPTWVDLGARRCDDGLSYDGTDCGYNVDPNASELAHMYYVTMGNRAAYSRTGQYLGVVVPNTGPFKNMPDGTFSAGLGMGGIFWTLKRESLLTFGYFHFGGGFQYYDGRVLDYKAVWAVHDGDVGTAIATATVPEASAYGQAMAGLLTLGAIGAWRRRAVGARHCHA
jgi:MYXO-CTERM domain-containing protein